MIIKYKDGIVAMRYSVRKDRFTSNSWCLLVDNEIFVINLTEEQADTLVKEISERFIAEEQERMRQEGKMSHDIYTICDKKADNEYQTMLDETLEHMGEIDR